MFKSPVARRPLIRRERQLQFLQAEIEANSGSRSFELLDGHKAGNVRHCRDFLRDSSADHRLGVFGKFGFLNQNFVICSDLDGDFTQLNFGILDRHGERNCPTRRIQSRPRFFNVLLFYLFCESRSGV